MPLCRSSEVRANTVYRSLMPALVIQHFVPLMTQSSPSANGLGRHRRHVAAGIGFAEAVARLAAAAADARQYFRFSFVRAEVDHRQHPQLGDQEHQAGRGARPGQLLGGDRLVDQRGALARRTPRVLQRREVGMRLSALNASQSYSAFSSVAAARGAILSSANRRTTARNSRCSSVRLIGWLIDAQQLPPSSGIRGGDLCRRHPQRRLRHHVGQRSRLVVVVQRVADALEQAGALAPSTRPADRCRGSPRS